MTFESGPKPPSLNEALAQISSSEQQAQAMGANDYEPSAFKQIKDRLVAGELTPTEAILQAQAVLNNKQDYH